MIDTESVETEIINHMKSQEPSYQVLAARTDLELDTVSSHIYCKLPKITLPQFTGDPLAWQGFQYPVSVHNNVSSISDIDKFNYLKGCL